MLLVNPVYLKLLIGTLTELILNGKHQLTMVALLLLDTSLKRRRSSPPPGMNFWKLT